MNDRSAIKRPSVVIVGAGFGGLNAAHALRDAEVNITLVDRNNFHTFQPLLYQVATTYLAPDEVGASLRAVFRKQQNLSVSLGEVTGVWWDDRVLIVDNSKELHFDYLLLGAGARVEFFGIPGMADYSWPLYTLVDAVRLREHLISRLEASAGESNPPYETVVVVGGGPTGVEMAGALTSMAHDLLGEKIAMRVVLVEALPHLLHAFSERSHRRALDDLRRRGVEVRLGTAVESASVDGVTLKGGERIETTTIVWAAGVRASGLGSTLGLATSKRGSIIVDPDLQVPGHPGVFAFGDGATIVPEPTSGQPPLLAPNAIQGGRHAAKQVLALIDGRASKPYRYYDKGMMAVVGRGNAVAETPRRYGGRSFGGRFAWFLWLGVHIVYLVGFRNRLKVLVDWGWSYFTSRGTSAILLPSDTSTSRRDTARLAKASDNT